MSMETPRLDFIVLGLPRSATTWLANWLTTERSLCLHEPFSYGMPAAWPIDERLRGISCTAAYLMRGWLENYDCPTALIERDPVACDASLRAIGLPGTAPITRLFNQADGRRFAYESLWHEEGARELWNFLLPHVPFDRLRYRLLQDMQIQPHMGKWMPDMTTMATLIGNGTLQLASEG